MMKLPSNVVIAAASGTFLVIAGGALMLATALGGNADGAAFQGPPPAAAARPDAGKDSAATQQDAARFVADASAPALAAGPDGTPEPYWLLKQREARERLLRSSGETGSVGVQITGGGSATRTLPAGSTATTIARPVTRQVAAGGQTPLAGVWGGTAEELSAYLLASNPRPSFSVPVLTLAKYYVRYAGEVGLRADILWAQMLHETGFGAYGGSLAAAQNNYAGIGATGGGVPGVTFPTAEDGVKAHVAHLAAYVFTDDRASWTNPSVDPRYDAVNPRGIARVLADLDGRWAVPGNGYGAAIERHVAAINR
jgi:Mannosyl-glycoprotein endo-beta-N-acetylglucosaminidase